MALPAGRSYAVAVREGLAAPQLVSPARVSQGSDAFALRLITFPLPQYAVPLVAQPKILLLGEPSLGLVPVIVQTLYERLTDVNRLGLTILLVEQNLKAPLRPADRGMSWWTGGSSSKA